MRNKPFDLELIISRWNGGSHQRAALHMLQEAMPPELLDPKSEWISCWYCDEGLHDGKDYNKEA